MTLALNIEDVTVPSPTRMDSPIVKRMSIIAHDLPGCCIPVFSDQKGTRKAPSNWPHSFAAEVGGLLLIKSPKFFWSLPIPFSQRS